MIQIIPAIDLIDGKCVRLTQGDFTKTTVYTDDPLEVALRFEAAGLRRLHIVDLDGARNGRPMNLSVLERLANRTQLTIDFGGGIKTEANLTAIFEAGASIANIGSLAVKQPELLLEWITKYGSERILLGADTKNGVVAINGWQTVTEIPLIDFLKENARLGITSAFVTDVSRDGSMAGPAVHLYRSILSSLNGYSLIASGGVRSVKDIDELDRVGCCGVIVGKALYEGCISLKELETYAR